jgi:hypothetical protein
MNEIVEISGPSKIEQCQRRFDTASEVVFGVNLAKDGPTQIDIEFSGLVDYKIGDDERKQKNAELAVEELFKSGAELEKTEKQEKLNATTPYSDEALALQKPGPREIAYDYVTGGRVRPDSVEVATEVYKSYLDQAKQRRSDFVQMRTKQVDWKHGGQRHEKDTLTVLSIESRAQIRDAQEFMNTRYNFDVPYTDTMFGMPEPKTETARVGVQPVLKKSFS